MAKKPSDDSVYHIITTDDVDNINVKTVFDEVSACKAVLDYVKSVHGEEDFEGGDNVLDYYIGELVVIKGGVRVNGVYAVMRELDITFTKP